MKISLLDDLHTEDWNRYVQVNPKATFYHRVEWKGVMERNFGHDTYYLTAKEREKVCGILPMVFIRSRLFGNLLCSMPFVNFGGIVADTPEVERALLEEASSLVERLKADYLELRHTDKSVTGLPTKTHKVSMTLDLGPDPDTFLRSYRPSHRRNIQKGIDSGLEFQVGHSEYLDPFYKILSTGWRDLGTPIYKKSFFRDVLETFGNSVEIALATLEGRTVAAACYGFHKGVAEGMWTYSLKEYRKQHSNVFLYWNLILRAREAGCKLYHLGRSSAGSNAQAYKKKWRAEPRQLYWEYVLGKAEEIPALDVSNPKYAWAIAAWRRLPVSITRLVGPLLSRNIP